MQRLWISFAMTALIAAGTLGSMGYSFQTSSGSIFKTLPAPQTAAPVEVKPLAVQPITDGTDARSRARSWFDPKTGQFCLGNEITKTCR